MINILVLCHANRWRSPLAAALMRHVIQQKQLDAQVVSAGFKESGKPAGLPVRNAALELGCSLEQHRSTRLTHEMLLAADHVVYMDGGNLRRLREAIDSGAQHRDWSGRLHPLGKYCLPARTRIEDLAFVSPATRPVDFSRIVNYIEHACRSFVDVVIAPAAAKGQD